MIILELARHLSMSNEKNTPSKNSVGLIKNYHNTIK